MKQLIFINGVSASGKKTLSKRLKVILSPVALFFHASLFSQWDEETESIIPEALESFKKIWGKDFFTRTRMEIAYHFKIRPALEEGKTVIISTHFYAWQMQQYIKALDNPFIFHLIIPFEEYVRRKKERDNIIIPEDHRQSFYNQQMAYYQVKEYNPIYLNGMSTVEDNLKIALGMLESGYTR